jgi:hypothetical protein
MTAQGATQMISDRGQAANCGNRFSARGMVCTDDAAALLAA